MRSESDMYDQLGGEHQSVFEEWIAVRDAIKEVEEDIERLQGKSLSN